MHPLLEKLLKKRGIKDVSELQKDEKVDFDKWQNIFDEGDITVDKISGFCNNQIDLIENQWKDLNISKERIERLVLLHNVYKTLYNLITGPKTGRESLERYLDQLLRD